MTLIVRPSPTTLRKMKQRAHDKGTTPCGNCQQNAHHRCRPRLDGTLCSCSCPAAKEIREEVEIRENARKNESVNIFQQNSTIFDQVVVALRPRYQKGYGE